MENKLYKGYEFEVFYDDEDRSYNFVILKNGHEIYDNQCSGTGIFDTIEEATSYAELTIDDIIDGKASIEGMNEIRVFNLQLEDFDEPQDALLRVYSDKKWSELNYNEQKSLIEQELVNNHYINSIESIRHLEFELN